MHANYKVAMCARTNITGDLREMKKNKRGEKSDKVLLKVIKNYPGFSQYELGRKLKWNTGHVDGSVRRLLKARKVFLRIIERNGRQVNLVYPKDARAFKLGRQIEVPSELLENGNPTWNEQAFFYALDNSTIGIAGHRMEEWNEISCFTERTPIRRNSQGKLLLRIPEDFLRFYNLDRKHRVVSVNGNTILITVSGEIVEEKDYPS